MSQQGSQFSPHIKAKANYKAISGKLVTSGISDIASASVHSEKTREEVEYDNYIVARKFFGTGSHTHSTTPSSW